MLCEVILEHQDVGDSRWWFSSIVISMLVKSMCKRSKGVVATIGCRGALGKSASMLQAMHTGLDALLHLTNHSWPPEAFL